MGQPDHLPQLAAFKAVLCGFVLVLIAVALAEFVSGSAHGYGIDTAALPEEARAILAERPLEPISTEQWRRLDKVMTQHGGWPGGQDLFAASVRHSWYWFIVLPAVAFGLIRRRARLSLPVAASLAGPSLLVLAFGFARQSALLQ